MDLTRRGLLVGALAAPLAGVLAACGSRSSGSGGSGRTVGSAGSPVTEATVVSPSTSFDVTTLYVPAGRPVTISYQNRHQGVPHNLHVSGPGVDAKTVVQAGPNTQTLTVTFGQPGDYGYVCDVHSSMTGVVRAV